MFAHYPDWKQYVVPPDLRWQSGADLNVVVPSRFAPNCPLRIEAGVDEITVIWGPWDEHCDELSGLDTEEGRMKRALELISEIICDRLVVIDYWKAEQLRGCSSCRPENVETELRRISSYSVYKDAEFTVRSWTGIHDRGTYDPGKLRSGLRG